MTDDQLIDRILETEGGFVNDPDDAGGATNFGITQRVLEAWRGHSVSVDDVRQMTRAEARSIYLARYLTGPGFSGIKNAHLRHLVVDSGVNHGVDDAAKWLQRAIGVKPDGIVGPITLHALAIADPRRVYLEVIAQRVRYYGRLIRRHPRYSKFAAGWLNRAAYFIPRTP